MKFTYSETVTVGEQEIRRDVSVEELPPCADLFAFLREFIQSAQEAISAKEAK